MIRVAAWSKLKAWAVAVAKHPGAKRAKVALARKIGVTLHRMWIDGADSRFTDKNEASHQMTTAMCVSIPGKGMGSAGDGAEGMPLDA